MASLYTHFVLLSGSRNWLMWDLSFNSKQRNWKSATCRVGEVTALVFSTWLLSAHSWLLTRWNLLNRCTEMCCAPFTALSVSRSHSHTHSIPPPPPLNICHSVWCAEQLVQSPTALSSEKLWETRGVWTIFKLNLYKVNMKRKKHWTSKGKKKTGYNSFFKI